MKGKSILCIFVVCAAVAPAMAEYVSIQHNMINGTPDTSYNATTKVLSWSSTNSNSLVLLDPAALGGTITNTVASLSTNFSGFDAVNKKALFTGGSFSLSFYRNGAGPYYINGPITAMVLTTTSATAVNGEGLFDAGTPYLPGDNDWPAPGLSSIKSLTIAFSGLPSGTGYSWDQDISGRVETSYTLFPNDYAAPEPGTCLLLLAGMVFVVRRRRARR